MEHLLGHSISLCSVRACIRVLLCGSDSERAVGMTVQNTSVVRI